MSIKLGDKVRILQHRNYFGGSVPLSECPVGTIITVSEWDDVNENGENGEWRSFTSVDVPTTWFRTDDVELVLDSPVRTETVTKRRIVPGVYGRLHVGGVNAHSFGPERQVDLGFVSRGSDTKGSEYVGYCMTATELDDLAMVASQLAEALRDVD